MLRGLLLFFLFFSKQALMQNSNSFFEKGKLEFELGNYTLAIENFEKCTQTSLWIKDLNYYTGMAAYNLKEYEKAIFYFTNELKHNKKNQKAYLFRALSKGRIGMYRKALRDFRKAVRLNRENSLVYYERGNLKFELKKYKKAIKDYKKTLQIRQGFEDAYYKIGFCKYYLKDSLAACENWSKIKELDDFENFELIEKTCKINN